MDESNEMDWEEMSKGDNQTESEDEERTASRVDVVVASGDEEAAPSGDKEVTASGDPSDQQMAWVMMGTWPAVNISNSGEESRLIPANLHKAAKKYDLKTVKMLLDQGTDIESRRGSNIFFWSSSENYNSHFLDLPTSTENLSLPVIPENLSNI